MDPLNQDFNGSFAGNFNFLVPSERRRVKELIRLVESLHRIHLLQRSPRDQVPARHATPTRYQALVPATP